MSHIKTVAACLRTHTSRRCPGRTLCLVLGLLLGGTGLAYARTLNQILSDGEIRVGVNPNFPPAAEYDKQDKLAGFDVDVSRKLAEMLGVKLKLATVDPNSRIPFLTADKIDYVMGDMTRTPGRAKLISFTVPIITEAFSVLTINSVLYNDISEMDNDKVTFVEVRGTTPVPYIRAHLPKAKLLLLNNWPDAFRAVLDGRANAIIQDVASNQYQMQLFPSPKWKLLKAPFGPVYYDCLGVAQGNTALKDWLNVSLFSLQEGGFIAATWKRWYGAAMVPPIIPNPYF